MGGKNDMVLPTSCHIQLLFGLLTTINHYYPHEMLTSPSSTWDFVDSVDVAVPEMPRCSTDGGYPEMPVGLVFWINHRRPFRQVTKHQTGQSQFESWFPRKHRAGGMVFHRKW